MSVTVFDYANRGSRAKGVTIGTLDLYFSYQTVIAFHNGSGTIIRQNSWSTTTGGHLNSIDGGSKEAKAARLSSSEFEHELHEVLQKHNLT